MIGYNIFVNLSSKKQAVVELDGAAASLARQSAASAKSAKKAREEFFAQRLAILVEPAKSLCFPS
jgi:hypothetical protein